MPHLKEEKKVEYLELIYDLKNRSGDRFFFLFI